MKYTSRQRVIAALQHKEADKVPIDFGATRSTGINALAYYKLRNHLRMNNGLVKIYDLRQLLAELEPEMYGFFQTDCVQLHRLAPSCGLKVDNWKSQVMMDGNIYSVPAGYDPVILEDGSTAIIDGKGRVMMKRPKGGLYFDDVYAPLAEITEEKELDCIQYPSISGEEIQFIKIKAAELYNNTDYAIVAPVGISIFEKGIKDFGYEEWLVKILTEEKLVIAYLERLTDAYLKFVDTYIEAVGKFIQVIQVNDDLGMQNATLLPPEVYRRVFKPFHQRIYKHIKRKAPHVYVLLHSCGSIYDLIPDLIEAGVDAINPVQINAEKMDPSILKKEFGRDITFWGGGVSTQSTLSFGSIYDVVEEVRRTIEIFSPGGGFIFSQIHNIQADISPDKVVALYKTAIENRTYSCE